MYTVYCYAYYFTIKGTKVGNSGLCVTTRDGNSRSTSTIKKLIWCGAHHFNKGMLAVCFRKKQAEDVRPQKKNGICWGKFKIQVQNSSAWCWGFWGSSLAVPSVWGAPFRYRWQNFHPWLLRLLPNHEEDQVGNSKLFFYYSAAGRRGSESTFTQMAG